MQCCLYCHIKLKSKVMHASVYLSKKKAGRLLNNRKDTVFSLIFVQKMILRFLEFVIISN